MDCVPLTQDGQEVLEDLLRIVIMEPNFRSTRLDLYVLTFPFEGRIVCAKEEDEQDDFGAVLRNNFWNNRWKQQFCMLYSKCADENCRPVVYPAIVNSYSKRIRT